METPSRPPNPDPATARRASRPEPDADSAGTGGPQAGWKVFLIIVLAVLAAVLVAVFISAA